jgi:hypothetical protein
VVLDAKALTWAARNNIDTAKLKAAKVPIYGKWYFPEIPADVPLVNLETGEQAVFPARMVAGEVIFVPLDDLRRASLLPADFAVAEPIQTELEEREAVRALATVAPEPLLAMARPVGLARVTPAHELDGGQALVTQDVAELAGIHMPSPSVAPFVLGLGFCLVFLGLITNVVILVVGLLWMLAGAITWIRVGVLEWRAASAHELDEDSDHT